MSLARSTAVAVLFASLAANAWLARALTRPAVAGARDAADPPALDRATGSAGAPEPRPAGELAGCGAEVVAQAEEVARKSEALRAVLPAQLLFERGAPNPEAERIVGPIVAAALAGAGARRSHTLACQDVACRLIIVEPATADEEGWDHALANDKELPAWSRDFYLADVTSAADGATVQRTVYLKLNGPKVLVAEAGAEPAQRGR